MLRYSQDSPHRRVSIKQFWSPSSSAEDTKMSGCCCCAWSFSDRYGPAAEQSKPEEISEGAGQCAEPSGQAYARAEVCDRYGADGGCIAGIRSAGPVAGSLDGRRRGIAHRQEDGARILE